MHFWSLLMSIFSHPGKCIGLVLAVAFVLQTPAHAVTFKIATLSPEGSGWMKLLREGTRKITEQTNGEVKFKIYPGGVMGDDKAVLRKIRVGQLHGAVLTAGGLVQTYPDIVLYNLPWMCRDNQEVDLVRSALDEQLIAGLRNKKFVGFGFAEVGFAYPMTQQAVTSVAQMRQRKVWTPDNDQGALEAFAAFDISPIPLPISDVLGGLQTGLIDSIGSPPIGTIALQWHTQVQYGLELPLIYVYGTLAMADRAFAKLSPAHQEIVREHLSAAVQAVDRSARNDHNSAKQAISNQGIEWLTPSSDEMSQWLQLASKARAATVADGHISEDLYQQVEVLLQQHRAGG